MDRRDPADTAGLVAAARRGEASAWEALVEKFLPLVCATIARHGLRGAEADDVNQSVWLRLVEHLDDLREPRALPGWIATTTRNECLRHFDRSRRTVAVDPHTSTVLDRDDDAAEIETGLLTDERQRALRAALSEMPDHRRELLLLLCADPPVSYAEISRRLAMPVGSIGPTRARALEQLRGTSAMREFLDVSTTREGEHHGAR